MWPLSVTKPKFITVTVSHRQYRCDDTCAGVILRPVDLAMIKVNTATTGVMTYVQVIKINSDLDMFHVTNPKSVKSKSLKKLNLCFFSIMLDTISDAQTNSDIAMKA